MRRIYIHEQSDWPQLRWRPEVIADALADVRHRQGRLLGRMEALGFDRRREAVLGTLVEDVVKSSDIEGEKLDAAEVRSSVARRLGMDAGGLGPAARDVEGIVELMLDATGRFDRPLTAERLFGWHASLFPTGRSGMRRIAVGRWRDERTDPMQVVSGPIGQERVHFEAPSAGRVDAEMRGFLSWFESSAAAHPALGAGTPHEGDGGVGPDLRRGTDPALGAGTPHEGDGGVGPDPRRGTAPTLGPGLPHEGDGGVGPDLRRGTDPALGAGLPQKRGGGAKPGLRWGADPVLRAGSPHEGGGGVSPERRRGADPVLRAGLAHLWFVTVHPFEDGNGRIARAVADMALARSEGSSQRFYSMSSQIRAERGAYYDVLARTQRGTTDVTDWMAWFLACLGRSIDAAATALAAVLAKARFWERAGGLALNDRQRRVLNRVLDGFEGKLTTSKWARLAKCSQDTALRDITFLAGHGLLARNPGGGRNTSYRLVTDA